MNRIALSIQIALAVTLTVLWLRWNPLAPECPECGDDDESDTWADAVPEPPGVDPEPPVELDAALVVEYGGCTGVEARGSDTAECVYEPGEELRLWVAHPHADEAWVEVDGHLQVPEHYEREEELGQGLRVRLGGRDLQRLRVGIHGQDEPWSLPLRASGSTTAEEQQARARLHNRLVDLVTDLAKGKLEVMDEVERAYGDLLARGQLSKAVEFQLGVSFHLGENGRPDLALAQIDRLRADAERYPRGRAAWSIYRGIALLREGRLVEAAAAFRDGGRYAVRLDDAGLQIDALSHYSMALADLGYFEASAYWGSLALAEARQHGRIEDLEGTLDVVAEANLALREAGHAHDDPAGLLRERLELYGEGGTLEVSQRSEFFHLGMAKIAVLDGRPEQALEHLDQLTRATATVLNPEQQARAIDLRLRALAARATPDGDEVRDALAQLERVASESGDKGVQWESFIRRGSVLERAGDLAGAQAAFEQAEDVLDDLIPMALLGISGTVAPARRRDGTQRLAAVLLDQRKPEQALCVLRQAQSRVGLLARLFRRLDEEHRSALRPAIDRYVAAKRAYESTLGRAAQLPVAERERAWRHAAIQREQLDREALEILSTEADYQGRPSCDALTPRQPGELIMGLYPLEDELLVLVQDDQGTTARRLAEYETLARADNLDWLGGVLLDPLTDRLRAAARVRVLASGAAAAIDVHALHWHGQSLVEQVPVVYGLDLPPLESRASSAESRALVVVDAHAKGTQAEAQQVQRDLGRAGWSLDHRTSSTLTTVDLRSMLSSAEHLHYAGHAYYDTGAGRHGARRPATTLDADDPVLRLWPPYPGGAASEPSYIPIGTRGRLDVQDILMMERVPQSVVLMGCATGVHDERMAYGGFSLATAFLGAGAEVVVASTREVDGDQAQLVGRGLYADFDAESVRQPGSWMQQAILRARAHELPADAIRDYRVYVP